MASLQTVYGYASNVTHTGASQVNPFSGNLGDSTPQAVALMLLFWGGVLFLLHKYGFRFNFGVAAK